MRLKTFTLAAAIIVVAAFTPFRAAAQNPETMMPDESAAKAKQILQQLIDTLGGPAYLQVRESLCEGRLAQFGHAGDVTGYVHFNDSWRYPDKNRTEYIFKGNKRALAVLTGDVPVKGGVVIELFAGDQGWSLDAGGVTEQPASAVADFQEQVKKDTDNLLRLRLKEDGMIFRYAGSDIVDLKPVDWVEIVDADHRTFRLAIGRSSHLLVRNVVVTRNDTTRERTEEVTLFSNYHPMDGVLTALQISRERDGRAIFQVFYASCKYNPGFPDDLFTKAGLDKHFSEIAKKRK